MRYFIEMAYDGTHFFGFQRQNDKRSIQGELEKALSTVYNAPIETKSSSRTDTGVHALQNYCHFDTDLPEPEKLVFRVNQLIGKEVAIKRIIQVEDDQHGRFDALHRTYHYFAHFHKDPFKENRSYKLKHRSLDVQKMNEAASWLLKYEEFDSFCKANTEVKTMFCDIDTACWEELEDGALKFTIRANRFLRGMVRAVVGTLIRVGAGQLSVEDFKQVIESKDRQNADFSPPGCGLYLVKIEYPYL